LCRTQRGHKLYVWCFGRQMRASTLNDSREEQLLVPVPLSILSTDSQRRPVLCIKLYKHQENRVMLRRGRNHFSRPICSSSGPIVPREFIHEENKVAILAAVASVVVLVHLWEVLPRSSWKRGPNKSVGEESMQSRDSVDEGSKQVSWRRIDAKQGSGVGVYGLRFRCYTSGKTSLGFRV